ncbi:hypothetical protein WISP_78447 [Willisornis vidua]|uniref:Uncharacterized protein n=1 Tax=Willisornis vidua TaxID=1566151 RepID=A0ABQ9D5E5_9PASS|nr:hypothetical protein WISP_78447 [Willisornis vidua]
MRLPLAFAVLLLALAQALGEEMGATDDLSYWSDWSDSDQAKDMARSLTKNQSKSTLFQFKYLDHLHDIPLDSLQQIHVLPVLETPELDTIPGGISPEWSRGAESPPSICCSCYV